MSSLAQAAQLTVPKQLTFQSDNGASLCLTLSTVVMMGPGGWLARRWSDQHGDVNLTWIVNQKDPPDRQIWLVCRYESPPPEAGEAIAPIFFINEPVMMVQTDLHKGWPPGLAIRVINTTWLKLPTFPEEN